MTRAEAGPCQGSNDQPHDWRLLGAKPSYSTRLIVTGVFSCARGGTSAEDELEGDDRAKALAGATRL